MRRTGTVANALAVTGMTPRLDDLTVTTAGSNVQCAFTVDESSLKNLVGLLAKYLH